MEVRIEQAFDRGSLQKFLSLRPVSLQYDAVVKFSDEWVLQLKPRA